MALLSMKDGSAYQNAVPRLLMELFEAAGIKIELTDFNLAKGARGIATEKERCI